MLENILGIIAAGILHLIMWIGFAVIFVCWALVFVLEFVQKYVVKFTRWIKEDKLNYV